MKEIELNFEIKLIGGRYLIVENGRVGREATFTEVLLWNLLWEIKTSENI